MYTYSVTIQQNANMNTGSMSKEYHPRTEPFFHYNFMNIKLLIFIGQLDNIVTFSYIK